MFAVVCHSMGTQANPFSDPDLLTVLGPFDSEPEAAKVQKYESCEWHRIARIQRLVPLEAAYVHP